MKNYQEWPNGIGEIQEKEQTKTKCMDFIEVTGVY